MEYAASLILLRLLVLHFLTLLRNANVKLVKLNKISHPHADFAETVGSTCINHI